METSQVGNTVGTALLLVWCGVLLLICIRTADQVPFLRRQHVAWQFLNVAGWVLLASGGFLAGAALLMFGVIGIFVVLIIVAMALVRLLMYRRNMLLWSLSAAARRELPLAPVARSAANELGGLGRRKAARLADMLEAGFPLAEALSECGLLSKHRGQPLIRVGQQCDAVAPALDQVVAADRADVTFWQLTSGRVFYLAAVCVFGVAIGTFVMWKIVPAYAKIFDDFDAELPGTTQILIQVTEFFVNWGWILFPFEALVLLALFYVTLRYIGMGPISWPIVNRLWRGAHAATVLRCLALAADRGKPFAETLATLAEWHPADYLQSRLRTAVTAIERGARWQSALGASRLFSASDLAFLDAAQRAGNLPWALRELADRSARRSTYRAFGALQVLTPLVVLLLGALVAMFVIALFLPLIRLITNLT